MMGSGLYLTVSLLGYMTYGSKVLSESIILGLNQFFEDDLHGIDRQTTLYFPKHCVHILNDAHTPSHLLWVEEQHHFGVQRSYGN
jgi:hypothetical protein